MTERAKKYLEAANAALEAAGFEQSEVGQAIGVVLAAIIDAALPPDVVLINDLSRLPIRP
jgi:hypothetical protein